MYKVGDLVQVQVSTNIKTPKEFGIITSSEKRQLGYSLVLLTDNQTFLLDHRFLEKIC